MRSSRRTASRIGTLLGVLALGMLALPPAAGAAPKPPPQLLQDSVTGSGLSTCGGPFEINAQSGPSGENPTGEATCGTLFSGPVTCLSVSGNVALVTVRSSGGVFGDVALRITDNPSGDRVESLTGLGCPTPLVSYFDLGFVGDLTVVDVPPLPVSKEQCRHGGWAQFGFKNQGQCIRFVRLIPGPGPYPSTKEQCRHGGWAQYGFKNKRRCLRFVRLTPNP